MKKVLKSECIIIGDEILDGRRTDTNSTWLGRKLSLLGCPPQYKQSVTDRIEDIVSALQLALSRSDLVICTGGLGPTTDDLTFEAVATFLKKPLNFDEGVWSQIQDKYALKKIHCPESNRRQAMLPESARVMKNELGTAPGIYFEISGKVLACFPGVPKEMKHLFETHFEKVLENKLHFAQRVEQKYVLVGAPESWVQDEIIKNGLDEKAEKQKDSGFRLAYTASFPKLEVTVSRQGLVRSELENFQTVYHQRFSETFDSFLASIGVKSIEETLIETLSALGLTLSIAESMTGGMLTSKLIDVSGSSKVLLESCVTYSNESKVSRLGVENQTLKDFGAVSQECAIEMARGMCRSSGSDFALATTGIAGPTGASEKKPMGLTYIALAGPKLETPIETCRSFHFKWGRNQNREMAVYEALKILVKAVKTQNVKTTKKGA